MRRFAILAVVAFAFGGLASKNLTGERPLVVYNGSESAPVGFYRRSSPLPQKEDFALVRSSSPFARTVSDRSYLPSGTPLVKRVAAVAGDTVCRHGTTVFVNGTSVATALVHDHIGRKLPSWEGCTRLRLGRVFLLQDHPRSFDGRYLGPASQEDLAGRLVRLALPQLLLVLGGTGR